MHDESARMLDNFRNLELCALLPQLYGEALIALANDDHARIAQIDNLYGVAIEAIENYIARGDA